MSLNSGNCITDLYAGTVAGEVTGIVAMPTDSSCYLSITASWATRKEKVFLNITGVILRALTFDGHSCLGNIFEQCLTVTLHVQTQTTQAQK